MSSRSLIDDKKPRETRSRRSLSRGRRTPGCFNQL